MSSEDDEYIPNGHTISQHTCIHDVPVCEQCHACCSMAGFEPDDCIVCRDEATATFNNTPTVHESVKKPAQQIEYDISYDVMDERHNEWARGMHNSDETLFQLTDVEHITAAQQAEWCRSMMLSRTSKRYVVKAKKSGTTFSDWVGIFRVDNIDHKNKSVMVGLDIDEKFRGKGLARPIYRLFLDYYFNQLGMNRVYLKVLETNSRAIHIYKELGFKEEGRDRQAIFRNGKFNDYICMSILKNEYHG